MAKLTYLGITVTNQNWIYKEIMRLNPENACCHLVQNLLSTHLLSKSLYIKMYKNIILLVVLYECKTWSLTEREKTEQGAERWGGQNM